MIWVQVILVGLPVWAGTCLDSRWNTIFWVEHSGSCIFLGGKYCQGFEWNLADSGGSCQKPVSDWSTGICPEYKHIIIIVYIIVWADN